MQLQMAPKQTDIQIIMWLLLRQQTRLFLQRQVFNREPENTIDFRQIPRALLLKSPVNSLSWSCKMSQSKFLGNQWEQSRMHSSHPYHQEITHCHTATAPKVNQSTTYSTTKTHTHTHTQAHTDALAWISRTQKCWEGRGCNRQH